MTDFDAFRCALSGLLSWEEWATMRTLVIQSMRNYRINLVSYLAVRTGNFLEVSKI